MIILIQSPAGKETILCDGPGRGLERMVGPLSDGCEIDDQRNGQPSEALRAASIAYYDRGNGRVAMSFQVTRECVSASAAFVWQIAFHANCVRSGKLYMIQDTFKALFPTALLNLKTKPLGVTRIITFSIQAGAPTLA